MTTKPRYLGLERMGNAPPNTIEISRIYWDESRQILHVGFPEWIWPFITREMLDAIKNCVEEAACISRPDLRRQ